MALGAIPRSGYRNDSREPATRTEGRRDLRHSGRTQSAQRRPIRRDSRPAYGAATRDHRVDQAEQGSHETADRRVQVASPFWPQRARRSCVAPAAFHMARATPAGSDTSPIHLSRLSKAWFTSME